MGRSWGQEENPHYILGLSVAVLDSEFRDSKGFPNLYRMDLSLMFDASSELRLDWEFGEISGMPDSVH